MKDFVNSTSEKCFSKILFAILNISLPTSGPHCRVTMPPFQAFADFYEEFAEEFFSIYFHERFWVHGQIVNNCVKTTGFFKEFVSIGYHNLDLRAFESSFAHALQKFLGGFDDLRGYINHRDALSIMFQQFLGNTAIASAQNQNFL